MQSKRSLVIQGLGTLAVGAGALGAFPATASGEEVTFSPNLRERILNIETTQIGSSDDAQPQGPIIPFNNFVFIRVVVPYNKFVAPKANAAEPSAPVSAVEAFAAVRRR